MLASSDWPPLKEGTAVTQRFTEISHDKDDSRRRHAGGSLRPRTLGLAFPQVWLVHGGRIHDKLEAIGCCNMSCVGPPRTGRQTG